MWISVFLHMAIRKDIKPVNESLNPQIGNVQVPYKSSPINMRIKSEYSSNFVRLSLKSCPLSIRRMSAGK